MTNGSILIELILWCFFIIPGVIYSIWRLTSRHAACPKCGAANMIPMSSPVAQQMHQLAAPALQTPPPPAERLFRVAKNGREIGSFTLPALAGMIEAGAVALEDYYFDEAANAWVEISALAAG